MEKTIYLNELYDYYGNLLTEKQRSYFQKYYFDNLTMQEIADLDNVSKNAVSKQLETIKNKLEEYEKELNLKSKKDRITKILTDEEFSKIEDLI